MQYCHVSRQIDEADYRDEQLARQEEREAELLRMAREELAANLWMIRRRYGPRKEWGGEAVAAASRAYTSFQIHRKSEP